jgi:hypothetical protein
MINAIKTFLLTFVRRIMGTQSLYSEMHEVRSELAELKTLYYTVKSNQDELKNLCNTIVNNVQTVQKLGSAIISNHILLHTCNNENNRKIFYIPFGPQENIFFDTIGDHSLCFKNNKDTPLGKRVFINTIPKAGTYFIGAVLNKLGFSDIEIHAGDAMFSDYRGKSIIEKQKLYDEYFVRLPYSVQVALTLPGQYLLGHVSADVIRSVHKKEKILLALRDLRYCIVSHMRFTYNRRHAGTAGIRKNFTPVDVIEYLTANHANFLFGMARECLSLKDESYIVRFEQLASDDLQSKIESARSICAVTGLSLEQVLDAIEKSYGESTLTFSGSLSQIEDLWSEEAEDLFVKHGGDILNEQLGYPRRYR